MSWNYRVMQYSDGSLGIHEVYYKDDGTVEGWTENAVGIIGDDSKEIHDTLDLVSKSIEKPILCYVTGEEIPYVL